MGNVITLGKESKLGEFSVSADANGGINFESAKLLVETSGLSGVSISSLRTATFQSVTIPELVTTIASDNKSIAVSFNPSRRIAPGTTETFTIYGVVSGTLTSQLGSPTLTTSFTSPQSFIWNDFIGGGARLTGEGLYSFPMNGYRSDVIAKSVSTGTYIGYMNGNAFITTQNITKDNALANCKTNALNNPNSSIRCTWNGEEIYLYTPPVVAGTYVNRLNGAGVDACNADIVAKLGSQKYSCTLGGGCSVTGLPPTTSSPSANPYIAGACIPSSVWNEGGSGTVSTIDQTSANGPKYNAMSCTKPTLTAVADGEIGCYGLWDYGNEFGDDVNMCGSYGDRKTGCVVQTSACQSGTAINSKVISPSQLLSSEISQVASKLKASDLSVKNQIITLWPYVCTSQVVGRVSHQASPQVLGASVSTMCTNLPINLHRGMEKPSVSRLQSFLAEKGFLSKDNVTGFYGDKTVEAVKDYQASAGLPVTGMVYNFTRETIQVESCR
jgi:hypothetical protein